MANGCPVLSLAYTWKISELLFSTIYKHFQKYRDELIKKIWHLLTSKIPVVIELTVA